MWGGKNSSDLNKINENYSRPPRAGNNFSNQKLETTLQISNLQCHFLPDMCGKHHPVCMLCTKTGPELTWVDLLKFVLCGFSPNKVTKR